MRQRTPVFRPSLLLSLIFGALAATTSPAHGESLKVLYEAARAYDASYLSAQALAESAQYRVEQVHAQRRPSVLLTVQAGRSISDNPAASTRYTASNAIGPSVQGQQSLFNRAVDASISQADLSLDIARAQLRSAEQDLIVRVAQAYFDVLAAQDTLTTVQANQKAISEQLASAKRNFEVGTATITDTREAQARYDLSTAQLLAAENDLRVKQATLDQQVGRSSVTPNPLALPVAVPPVQPSDVAPWLRDAEKQSPAIQQALTAFDVAKLETAKARAGNLPTVGLSASYGKSRISVDGRVLSNSLEVPYSADGTKTDANVGVALTLPLYQGGAIQNRIKETLQLEEKARQDLDVARRSVSLATRQAFLGVQSLRSQVQAYEAAESSSKLALDATQLGYKVGVRVNLDVLNAQAQLYATQQSLAKARYDVIVSGLRLRQAAGVLMPGDVDAVNSLLAP
jgi:outer membrane protein